MYHAGMRPLWLVFILFLIGTVPLLAEREKVLKQIELPHHYYYREMYLPQLTTGPSSVSWSPKSREVVYSMAGSLWRQALDSTSASQLTAGPGYDYQPDWSPDGKSIAFARYDRDTVELQLLEIATGQVRRLTSGGAVNVEPKWSPDGKKIAFVSTADTKHFHIFVADFADGKLVKPTQLVREQKSDLPRYYYSAFDHEINPTWSPDSAEIIFVSNRGHIQGTGGFWRMKAEPSAEAREIRYEETSWKARPDWSPDGKRVVYSSYLGRQWNQLWIMTSEGGDPFPLTYGEFDNTAPRWSHDGEKIAFISNRNGNTSLWIQDVTGGRLRQMEVSERKYLLPMGTIRLLILDSDGKPASARVSITGEDGRAYSSGMMHADDSFDRAERPFEAHYVHSSGESLTVVPVGKVTIEVLKGFKHEFERREVNVRENRLETVELRLQKLSLPASWRDWISADLHVHMNYGGTYRNTPEHLMEQAAAEDLDVVNSLIVNKEQRIPDIAYFTGKPEFSPGEKTMVLHSQEFHTSFWGHLGLLGLTENILIPDYANYPNTAAASLYPTNRVVADMAHAQQALVGYVHPFDPGPEIWKDARALPVDVALGTVDYLEVVGFSDHITTAGVWYRLLNCGFRLPAGAGTDAMANYASLRGPVGMNRVYVRAPAPLDRGRFLDALQHGKTFGTNGPLLGFTINGQDIGGEITLPAGKQELQFDAYVRSVVPVDHLEIVFNGNVVRQIELKEGHTTADAAGQLTVEKSGWFVLRAWSEKSEYPVLDKYAYATTSPIYITVGSRPVRSPEDAAYFIDWIDKVAKEADSHQGYNTGQEKTETLRIFAEAKAIFERLK